MKVYNHGIYDHVTVFEMPKKQLERIDFALCEEPSETLKEYYDRQEEKPDLLSNGGIFHLADGQTYFNFIDEGDVVSGWHWYNMGMGIVDGKLKYGNVSDEKWTDFVSGYPPLVEDSKALPITFAKEIDGKKKRKVLAYNADTVFLIEIWKPGMRFAEMQDMLLAMGVTHAINLDGGDSVMTLVGGKAVNKPLYQRPVDNGVAIYMKEPLKRVQVGAFTNYLYALAMQAKIRALPDYIGAGYKNAYVRKIGKYYKVQVGAFSKWAGANLVLADLKAMGFDAFITTE